MSGCRHGEHIHARRVLNDARGIFVAYVCDACEGDVRKRYRPDIFTDSDYWHDEPIGDEEDDEDFAAPGAHWSAPFYGDGCSNPTGHKWVYTGASYDGDDERWHGEGRCYCEFCGADGDA